MLELGDLGPRSCQLACWYNGLVSTDDYQRTLTLKPLPSKEQAGRYAFLASHE